MQYRFRLTPELAPIGWRFSFFRGGVALSLQHGQYRLKETDSMTHTIADLLQPPAQARAMVVFTEAATAAEGGVPTCRDGATGLWGNIDPE